MIDEGGALVVTYGGEETAPNVAADCREYPCDRHYVVRSAGLWVRAFHDEAEARRYARAIDPKAERA